LMSFMATNRITERRKYRIRIEVLLRLNMRNRRISALSNQLSTKKLGIKTQGKRKLHPELQIKIPHMLLSSKSIKTQSMIKSKRITLSEKFKMIVL